MQADEANTSVEKGKRTYEKPKLRVIELHAEEVLGINCFNPAVPTSGAYLQPGCDFASNLCHTG